MELRDHFITVERPFKEGNVEGFQQIICEKNIKKAVLKITALGVYCAYIDDKKVGDAILTPGFTYYPRNLHYQEYDVTDMLKENSVLKVYLGQGWYCGRFTFSNTCKIYGDNPGVSWMLTIETDKGKKTYYSGENTKNICVPYSYAGLYDGEEITYPEKESLPIVTFKEPIPEVIEKSDMLIRIREEMPIKNVTKRDDSTYIIDFGQNFAGVISINPSKMDSDMIKVCHGEILNEDGSLYVTNLRKAKQTIIYKKSDNQDIYTPSFTYMGFRYIEVSGCTYTEGLIKANAVYSDMERTGYFECSNEYINRIYENQIWGQKSNYIEVPTDCPQRDERMGYTGDGQVFACTGAYNYNTVKFWHKFLKDIRYSQMDSIDGYVPATIPASKTPSKAGFMSMLGWGNCDLIVPELMYNQFGDISFIENQYESMKAFVECEISKMGGIFGKKHLWISPSLGDWLALGRDVAYMAMHNGPVSNAFVVNDMRIMSWAAKLLGKNDDYEKYILQYENSKKAYIKAFVKKDGKMKDDYQGAYIMALKMVIDKDDPLWEQVYQNLKDKLQNKGMQTGFFATEHVFTLLAENGDIKLAYDLLFNENCPGWIYQIKLGATTCWERWDAITPERNVNETKMSGDNMVSFNHYSFGSVGRFYYQHILGINPMEPGFSKARIEPKPDKRINWAKGSYECKYGTIKSEWKYDLGKLKFDIETPVESLIVLPNGQSNLVEKGDYHFEI